MMQTNLSKIWALSPCPALWDELVAALGNSDQDATLDTSPLSAKQLIEAIGFDRSIDLLEAFDSPMGLRRFATFNGEQMLPLLSDSRSIALADAAIRFCKGRAYPQEVVRLGIGARARAKEAERDGEPLWAIHAAWAVARIAEPKHWQAASWSAIETWNAAQAAIEAGAASFSLSALKESQLQKLISV